MTNDIQFSTWADLKRFIDPIGWDWPGWLPRGFVTVLAAEPGMGKSFLCLQLAASYIEGKALPDGRPFEGERGRVIWCEGEGSQALNLERAAGWGLNLADIVSPLPNPLLAFRMDDEKHMVTLLHLCRRPEVGLVVMDSLSSLVTGGPTPSGRPSESVRGIPRALQMLGEAARLSNKPIILTHHLRKRTSLDDWGRLNLDRIRGTSKITQSARVVWTLDAPNVLDPQHKRLMIVKNNLAHDYKPLGMRITSDGITFDDPPEILTHTQSKINAAADFLLQYLRQGPQPAATRRAS
jgi:putative DNA primase/helicase